MINNYFCLSMSYQFNFSFHHLISHQSVRHLRRPTFPWNQIHRLLSLRMVIDTIVISKIDFDEQSIGAKMINRSDAVPGK